MFTFYATTHYMLEHGEPAGCFQSGGGVTLGEAIADACRVQEEYSDWCGRGPKIVHIEFADANDGEQKGLNFKWFGDWSAEVSLTCTRQLIEAFDVKRSYYNWGC